MKVILNELHNTAEIFINNTDSIVYQVRDVKQTKSMISLILESHVISYTGTLIEVNYINGEREIVKLP